MERFGGNPKTWFDKFVAKKGLRELDRNYHELETLCEALFHFGSYDQLNGGACASAEVLVRRVFGIVDALSSGVDRASWHNASYFMGGTTSDDLVPMEMKTYVSRRAKEDSEANRSRGIGRTGDGGGGADSSIPPRGGLPPPGGALGTSTTHKKKKGGKGGGGKPGDGK